LRNCASPSSAASKSAWRPRHRCQVVYERDAAYRDVSIKAQSRNTKPRRFSRERSAPSKSHASKTSGSLALPMSASMSAREIVYSTMATGVAAVELTMSVFVMFVS
jgi:hypothetical protein